MSARVLHPVMLTEFYKISSPKMMKRNLPSNRKLNTIKKDLFGSPNPNETKRIFEDELEKHQDLACKKWGFDFRNGYPVVGNSQYVWERVTFNDFVPEMYTLSRAAHFRELPVLETSSSDEDILMDERAAKENELSVSNFKCNLLSDGATTEDDEYDDDDCDDDDVDDHDGTTIIFEVPIDRKRNNNRIMVAAATTACNSLRMKRRQSKITEFMKERRKRLSSTPKKMISPIKKMRMTSSPSTNLTKATSIAAGILNKRNKSPGKCNLFSSSSEGGGGRF